MRFAQPRSPDAESRCFLLFGSGLIGSAVLRCMGRTGAFQIESWPFDWECEARQDEALEELRRALGIAPPGMLEIIWSAGRAGFAATAAETEREFATFQRALRSLVDLAAASGRSCGLTLISSLGGLHEGQHFVTETSSPSPARPYGHLKLAQEEFTRVLPGLVARRVLRVASVYGPIHAAQRTGFISTLVRNVLTAEITPISGSLGTLRDYVWADDVARYVVRCALENRDGVQKSFTALLASGRSRSILEIIHQVQRICGRRPLVSLAPPATNGTDLTVSPSALPEDWYSTSLEHGIARIAEQWKRNGGAKSNASAA